MNKTRTRDGRFIDKRVKFQKDLIRDIIFQIKRDKRFNWYTFAEKLGVSEYTLKHDYFKNDNTIPLSIVIKILNLHHSLSIKDIDDKIEILEPFWGQKTSASKNSKNVIFPELTNEFAEFYGIMLGDGCIYSNLNGFCITCDSKLDRDYVEKYISALIESLFGIKPKIYFSRSSRVIRCVVYSRKLSYFLNKNGMPLGKKVNSFNKIPKKYFQRRQFLISLVRGLADTDGSVFPHPSAKIILEISIKNHHLMFELRRVFDILNFQVKATKDIIYLHGPEMVKKYFSIFGTSNKKHAVKYKMFIETNKVPKTNELIKILDDIEIGEFPYNGPVV